MSGDRSLAIDHFDSLVEAIPNPAVIVTYDQSGATIVAANQPFQDTFNLTGDSKESRWKSVLPESVTDEFNEIHGILADGENIETDIRVGSPVSARFTVTGTTDEDSDGNQFGIIVCENSTPDTTLQECQQQLEAAESELQQLVYVVSHDLKEPIRMVTSYLDLLEMELDELDEETEEYIYYAVDGADRMQTLLDNLLEFSRIKTHENPHVEIDLNETVENAKLALMNKLDNSDTELTIADLPTLPAEPNQSDRLFEYLLDNAIAYTDDTTDPVISIDVTEHVGHYEFTVSDNGSGVAADQHDHIFEVFTRGPDAEEYTDGEGSGLAVCKRIVENHGGDIWVDSEKGEGATFHFTLTKENSNPDE